MKDSNSVKHVTIIPSKGRADYFLKYKDLPIIRFNDPIFNTVLWVYPEEYEYYKKSLGILGIDTVKIIVDETSKNISEKRQKILNYCNDNGYDYLFTPDDDVRIYSRESEFKSVPLDLDSNIDFFNHLSSICSEKYPLVSLRDRYFINSCKVAYEKNYKAHCIYFYYIPVLIKHNISFIYKDLKVYEDRVTQLALHQNGYVSCATSMYVQRQRHGNNSTGGCSDYRTIEEANRGARIIQQDFPEYVSLYWRYNWAIGKRLEIKLNLKRFIPKGDLKHIPIKEMEKFVNRENAYKLNKEAK